MTTELFRRHGFGGPVSVSAAALNLDDANVAFGDTEAIFNGWGGAAISLAVWRRDPPDDIAALLAELRLEAITGWRRIFDAANAGAAIAEAMAESRFSTPALKRFLAADMALLTRIFETSTGTSRVEARLDIIRDDACRRFHVDNYPARMVVTYVGPGTVAVPRCHGEKALFEQDDYSGPSLEIPGYSVGLFAGEAAGREGLVHRSPRIAGTGRMRLFFCVNAARH